MNNVDIVVGLQYGDEGKGKVTNQLLKERTYTHVLRYNGGSNAGHTIYNNGKKFVTHLIPAGVLHGVTSVIGQGCVLNVEKFSKEVEDLSTFLGKDISDLVKISDKCHIVTKQHLIEDGVDTSIGTTRTGNGPAYRDKYYRQGTRAKDVEELKKFLVDIYEEFYYSSNLDILCEGAQGFGIDIDWGEYPFVTSSHCTSASALLNGISPHWVVDIFGVAKCYETYVGARDFEPGARTYVNEANNNEIELKFDNTWKTVFQRIREIGGEYGATTGRPRQVNFLNIDNLIKSIHINGCNVVVLNKLDILRETDEFCLCYDNGFIEDYENEESFKSAIEEFIAESNENISDNEIEVIFSDNPETF